MSCVSIDRVEADLCGEGQDEPLAGNYFVAAYPPFSVWDRSQRPALQKALQEPARSSTPLGCYVHLPFCQKKCDYCYYLSYIRQKQEVVDRYVASVTREMELYAGHPAVSDRQASFVYFGGGTPSTLTPAQIETLGTDLRTALPWDENCEVTFECAPRSVRSQLIKSLRKFGVSRLSMGVQSFDDDLLRLNGRVHLANDVSRAYQQLRSLGIDLINLDLMVGLIGETEEKWNTTVRRAIEFSPESITIYQTEIPYNTKLYQEFKSGTLPASPVSWATKRSRLEGAFQLLERAGYTVVNAYAAVKDPELHRFHYQDKLWRGCDMLGLGVASFGYFGGVHYQNECALPDYEAAVEKGDLPVLRAHPLSPADRMVREFILQLKLGRVEDAPFHEKFGLHPREEFQPALEELQRDGYLTTDASGVMLTRKGLLKADRLLPRFYDPRYSNTRYS